MTTTARDLWQPTVTAPSQSRMMPGQGRSTPFDTLEEFPGAAVPPVRTDMDLRALGVRSPDDSPGARGVSRCASMTMTANRLLNGRFRLLKNIGRGGQGTVWLAEDTVLRREVALKQLVEPTCPRGCPGTVSTRCGRRMPSLG